MGFYFVFTTEFVFSELNHCTNHSRNSNLLDLETGYEKNTQKNLFKLWFRQQSVENLDRQKNNFVTV